MDLHRPCVSVCLALESTFYQKLHPYSKQVELQFTSTGYGGAKDRSLVPQPSAHPPPPSPLPEISEKIGEGHDRRLSFPYAAVVLKK